MLMLGMDMYMRNMTVRIGKKEKRSAFGLALFFLRVLFYIG